MEHRKHIAEAFDEAVRAGPDKPALTVGDDSWTFAELKALSQRAASHLKALGVEQDDIVILPMPNSVEQTAFFYGCWRIGATPMALSPVVPEPELQKLMEGAKARLVLREGQNYESAPLWDGPYLLASRTRAKASGGSTGMPKVIIDTQPSYADSKQDFWGWTEGPTMFVPGPTFHSGPMNHLMGGLSNGIHVVMMRKFDAEHAVRLIGRHRPHWALFVPTMMNRILKVGHAELAAADLTCLKRVWTSAAYCPAWLKQAWIDIVGPDALWEIFGGSEGVATTIVSGREALDHPGSVGRPAGNGEIAIFDSDGKPVPAGQVGEIYMRNKVDARRFVVVTDDKKRTLGDWESFGDMGWMDEDGYLYLADRRVDMINSGGQNIYPAEVEAAIQSHPQVGDAVVFGRPDDDLGEVACALVYVESGAVTEEDLLEHLSGQITRYKIPRRIEFSDEPIRNDAGKVRRRELRGNSGEAVAVAEGSG